jgi:hypothetical protein
MKPRWALTPRRTDRLIVSHNVTLTLVQQYLTHLFNLCLRLSHFPNSWKEAKIITLPKPVKDPKFPQNLHPTSLLSTKGKLFEKFILKIVQRHNDERGLLNASQFGFRARHSTTTYGAYGQHDLKFQQ